jgi:capsular polysaccharide export protein
MARHRSRDPVRQARDRPRGLWRHPPDPRHRHRGGRTPTGITVHVFEEGYIRPYWVTYERGGANGNSPAHVDDDRRDAPRARRRGHGACRSAGPLGRVAPARLLRRVYHGLVLLANRRYAAVKPHRTLSVRQEFLLYLKRLGLMSWHWLDRVAATRASCAAPIPTTSHSCNWNTTPASATMARSHRRRNSSRRSSPVSPPARPRTTTSCSRPIPLEDGRAPLLTSIRRAARRFGIGDRVHFVRGGKLAPLLDGARSAVTVNSTSAQQALWRGLPLKCFGAADLPQAGVGLRSAAGRILRDPRRPDSAAYAAFRQYLLRTSQLPGSYYSAAGRRRLLREITDRMLSAGDVYATLRGPKQASKQHLRTVR